MNAPPFAIDPIEFSGKRVFVTGGTKGAGEAMVRRFAAGGAHVATTARTAPKTSDLPGVFVAADLSSSTGAAKAAEAIIGALGPPDILVHNLGGSNAGGGGFASRLTAKLCRRRSARKVSASPPFRRGGFIPPQLKPWLPGWPNTGRRMKPPRGRAS